MPFIQRAIQPVNVSRVEVGKYVSNELECVTNHTLSNIIHQLSSLSQHAEDMFGELTKEAEFIWNRSNQLQLRISNLKNNVNILLSSVETISLEQIHKTKPYKTEEEHDQQVVSKATMSIAMLNAYNQCDKIPRLDKFDELRDDGTESIKLYSNPMYFFELWYAEIKKRIAAKEAEKKKRKQTKLQKDGPPQEKNVKTKRENKINTDRKTKDENVSTTPMEIKKSEDNMVSTNKEPLASQNGQQKNKNDGLSSQPLPPPPSPPPPPLPLENTATSSVAIQKGPKAQKQKRLQMPIDTKDLPPPPPSPPASLCEPPPASLSEPPPAPPSELCQTETFPSPSSPLPHEVQTKPEDTNVPSGVLPTPPPSPPPPLEVVDIDSMPMPILPQDLLPPPPGDDENLSMLPPLPPLDGETNSPPNKKLLTRRLRDSFLPPPPILTSDDSDNFLPDPFLPPPFVNEDADSSLAPPFPNEDQESIDHSTKATLPTPPPPLTYDSLPESSREFMLSTPQLHPQNTNHNAPPSAPPPPPAPPAPPAPPPPPTLIPIVSANTPLRRTKNMTFKGRPMSVKITLETTGRNALLEEIRGQKWTLREKTEARRIPEKTKPTPEVFDVHTIMTELLESKRFHLEFSDEEDLSSENEDWL